MLSRYDGVRAGEVYICRFDGSAKANLWLGDNPSWIVLDVQFQGETVYITVLNRAD